MVAYIIAILCVFGLAIGQILFKFSAASLSETGSYFSLKTATSLFLAFLIYAITSLAWVWVLQKIDLGRVYPLTALAFILVPLGSYVFFGERYQAQYLLGVLFIVFGIILAARS
jgi:drug/metabolite transporter (DMT)-like permease